MSLTKLQLVESIFKPNHLGISEWILRENLIGTALELTNNGNIRYGVAFGVKKYIWEFQRKNNNRTGKLLALRTNGFNTDLQSSHRPIAQHIRDYYQGCVCVVCGTQDIIIDHKNDLYNDPRVLSVSTQTVEDFQPLCNSCNLRKRQVSKITRATGKRYSACNIPMLAIFEVDFIEGDESYDPSDVNAMVGTYWYDPVRFMEYVKEDSSQMEI